MRDKSNKNLKPYACFIKIFDINFNSLKKSSIFLNLKNVSLVTITIIIYYNSYILLKT